MSKLLRDIFSPSFYDKFCNDLKSVLNSFDKEQFLSSIFDENWDLKSLKERMRHTSNMLYNFLPSDFDKATDIICCLVVKLQKEGTKEIVIEYCFLPDFIEQFGINYYEKSIKSFEIITQLTSCEFAVRPFLIKYKTEMEKQMLQWSLHKNEKVRRLSCEGIRPRLPWAIALPQYKSNPTPIFPILENLKNDNSEIVRKSVANNLNDISKDNPEIIIALLNQWKGISKETDKILKHGCRTLLKKGNTTTLNLFGINTQNNIEFNEFKVLTPNIKIGEYLEFYYSIKNNQNENLYVRFEYCIYFKISNGKFSRKVFKISEKYISKFETIKNTRKHNFKVITTRKYYLGIHKVALIVNGKELQHEIFELN